MIKFLSSYRIHLLAVYLFGLSIVLKEVYSFRLLTDYQESISFLAIVSTFGASLTGVGVLLSGDCLRRILLNVDIMFKDILNEETPWRRWPFLKRKSKLKDLNNNTIESDLKNPVVPFYVGTHNIEVSIPTVENDFFDLPVLKNLWQLIRYRGACITLMASDDSSNFKNKFFEKSSDQYMALICLRDIWLYIFIYRFFRYLTHLGVALSLYGFIFWFYLLWI